MRKNIISALLALLFASVAPAQTLVDIATNATDPSNLADSEPSIAVNPTNPQQIAVVTFSEGWTFGGTRGPMWVSNDGGTTWSKNFVLTAPAAGSGGPGDQKLSYSAAGTLYVAELGLGVAVPRCFIYRPSGPNWIPGAAYGDDQPMMESSGGTRLSPWLNFGVSPEQSTSERTPDDGVTVAQVGIGSTAFPNRTTRIAVDPTGAVYVIYKTRQGVSGQFETATFRVVRSTDAGVTWNTPGVAVHPGTVQTWFTNFWGNAKNGGKIGRARSSDGWIAVNPTTGAIWVVYCNRDASTFGQIYAATSTDGGNTWSSPVRVTDGTHNSAYPEVAVAANGTVGVMYIDYDDSGAQTVYTHRLARSFNNGAMWNRTSLQSLTTQALSNGVSGFLWGDYEGLTAVGNTFLGVFTGQSIGRAVVQFDPIFYRVSAVPPVAIQVPAPPSFEPSCLGDKQPGTLKVCNTGAADLVITSITSSNPEFTIVSPSGGFPVTVSHDFCFPFTVTFTPIGVGVRTTALVIVSNDPSIPTLTVQATAVAGEGSLGLAPDELFPPTVIRSVGACQSSRPLVVSNKGTCNLTITNIAIGGPNPGDFSLSGLPVLPITLEPGHTVGSGDLEAVFTPTAVARERTALATVTFVSDPATGTTSSRSSVLCGEGVRTGARVLVTLGGVPMPEVHEIELKRLHGGWFGFAKEVDEVKKAPLQTVTPTPGTACASFQFHREYGAVSNSGQLVPGVYQLKVEAIIGGKEVRKATWFNVDTCGFDGTLVVDF